LLDKYGPSTDVQNFGIMLGMTIMPINYAL
jgi:hypothetical protein